MTEPKPLNSGMSVFGVDWFASSGVLDVAAAALATTVGGWLAGNTFEIAALLLKSGGLSCAASAADGVASCGVFGDPGVIGLGPEIFLFFAGGVGFSGVAGAEGFCREASMTEAAEPGAARGFGFGSTSAS